MTLDQLRGMPYRLLVKHILIWPRYPANRIVWT